VSNAGGEPPDLLTDEAVAVTVARLRLRIEPSRPVPCVDHVRAAVAAVRPELDLLHQHGPDGLIYRYPRVIYRVEGGTPLVVAAAEGAEALLGLTLVGQPIRLGVTTRRVADTTFDAARGWIGPARAPVRYRFGTPWLALNQPNHDRYLSMERGRRQSLLEGQIANNCLSMAKSFGLRISARLSAIAHLRPVPVRFKGFEMLGFLGHFEVNFSIPGGLGLGKSVSRGYGAVTGEI
jgi:hypothetical protein